ncbi:hypothetical protein M405DRAFT_810716 [Rhizopogon salebrosus TDB-379]|nr:hypothetical protein M405DRAFT_810716 [Rhizopogon salebrosus TDB-379]
MQRSLIASLIDCHLTSDTANLSYNLLRRVLTALIHHCNGSEQCSVVVSLVVDRFCTLSQAEDFVKGLDYLLYSRLASLPLDASFHSEILNFASSLLNAGDMAMSAGPGHTSSFELLASLPSA